MTTPLGIHGLTKAFGGNAVLKGIDLTFAPGQIHALLGPNGAGKSTTLGCITGAQTPDGGTIVVGGREYADLTPRSSHDAGIAIIYQHAQLADDLTVADNVFLGRELRTRAGAVDIARQRRLASEALQRLGVDVDVRRLVRGLSVGQQQLVEIARALVDEPDVLILDEPTAALSDSEIVHLMDTMRHLAHERGLVVVFVTHILREVLDAADVVTVIRDGVVLWTREIAEVSLRDLIEGISPNAPKVEQRSAVQDRPALVELAGFCSKHTGPVDLVAGEGEIVGLFGVLGAGRTDLLETMAGVRSRAGGRLTIAGRAVESRSPGAAAVAGIALVPSDRKEQAIFGEMSALENLLMPHFGTLATGGVRRRPEERRLFAAAAAAVRLSPSDPAHEGAYFSGGNAQKLVLSRWVAGLEPRPVSLLLLDDPTQGVDIGSRYEIYDLVRGFASQPGRAVLFASNEPEELLGLADRIAVVADGHVVTVRQAGELDEQSLLQLAHEH